jgi:dihydrofolate reductase
MIVSLIAAMAENRVIGKDNDMPWHLPADLKHFRRNTIGKPVIMGRRTHESIGHPLPQRLNIVLTRDPGYQAPGCIVADSPDAALAAAGDAEEVMVMGGATLYQIFMERARRIYLTEIHAKVEGDTYFPEFTPFLWKLISREDHQPDEDNPLAYSFLIYERDL